MALLPGFVSAVLENETNAIRFEKFVTALISTAEGEIYLPTSRNYDQGRDARALRVGQDGIRVIAATITRVPDLAPKVDHDIKRLLGTTKLRSITYCCSADLTEAALDKIIAQIRVLVPATTAVRGLALSQLTELGLQFEGVMETYYGAELNNLKSALLATPDGESPDVVGLRLALRTQTGDDALNLKRMICRQLVLEQLYSERGLTANGLATKMSARLHLPRTISEAFLTPVLDSLCTERLIEGDGGKYVLTEAGAKGVQEVAPEAASRLLEGRVAVYDTMKQLLGYSLAEQDFERFWAVFQDGIAELFYRHGASIIEMLASLEGVESNDDDAELRSAGEELADKVAALFQNQEQREEVRQCVVDLFLSKGTPAFDWLTSVCSMFVMMCSLGLETKSAAEVSKVLRGITLLPDTDVAISLLCSGEPNHEEVTKVLQGWRALGGAVNVPVPVLEEVAHHAWIADADYFAVKDTLRGSGQESADHTITNAFVRTFRLAAHDPSNMREWQQFIDQFRGASSHDYTNVLEILRGDLAIEPFPDLAGEIDTGAGSFCATVREYLLKLTARDIGNDIEDLDERARDKIRRDALILATIMRARQKVRASGAPSKSVIAVSSARRLRKADLKFRRELGQPSAVLSIAAVAALLALTPGVQMGVGALRAVLFDLRLAKRLSPGQLLVYRLVARSDQYELPLSRRTTLGRRLREQIVEDARKTGRHLSDVEDDVLTGKDPAHTAAVVSAALDKMAVTSRVEETIVAQQKRIRALESELAALRREKRA